MNKKCREVVDMIAEGEALGSEHESHIAKCLTCARTIETRNLIAAASQRRNQVSPRPGFPSRAAAGALERAARYRRRGGLTLLGSTVAAAAAVVAFFAMKPEPIDLERPPPPVTTSAPVVPDVVNDSAADDTSTVAKLLELADVDESLSVRADWEWLEQPLAIEKLLAERTASDDEE